MKFPFYKQLDEMDCGPTCLKMIAKFHGRNFPLHELRQKSFITKEGVSLLGISEAAEAIGFRTTGVRASYDELLQKVPLPCILHWNQNHFVVLYDLKSNKATVADPEAGLITYSKHEFLKSWSLNDTGNEGKGFALILEPTTTFHLNGSKDERYIGKGFRYLLGYVSSYKKHVLQLFIGLLIASIFQLILPILMQSIVDVGISSKNLSFIYTILIAQLTLVLGRTFAEFTRRWILIHLSNRINLKIISDFLAKLMKLPMSFFDSKKTGDILQRIEDHNRIERFLNSSSLGIFFSFFNLTIFSVILFFYSVKVLTIFFIGSVVYLVYIFTFLKLRKEIDNKRFNEQSKNRISLIQLIRGIQDIKLNNCEDVKRHQWELIQARLFSIGIESTKLQQWQDGGGILITEIKNILTTLIAATSVTEGNMTLGMMMSVQYIIGQLNAPIAEFVNFTREFQDAQISLDRIGEVHNLEEEENKSSSLTPFAQNTNHDIILRKISFQYEGPLSPRVLNGIDLTIEYGKITAIVGISGSGKTTILKLLLKYYHPTEGTIFLGDTNIDQVSAREWRKLCGTVMQDGFIFSDTIANNINVSGEIIDEQRLMHAARMANIDQFIESLPLGFNTVIGSEGSTLSAGQKQRILIARAVYKNPQFLLFDEATSALDANNEQVIMKNLDEFFNNKTVVIIAHRLSTVMNADKIVVLEDGRVIEEGTHLELSKRRGRYFELVKNQLSLGE